MLRYLRMWHSLICLGDPVWGGLQWDSMRVLTTAWDLEEHTAIGAWKFYVTKAIVQSSGWQDLHRKNDLHKKNDGKNFSTNHPPWEPSSVQYAASRVLVLGDTQKGDVDFQAAILYWQDTRNKQNIILCCQKRFGTRCRYQLWLILIVCHTSLFYRYTNRS